MNVYDLLHEYRPPNRRAHGLRCRDRADRRRRSSGISGAAVRDHYWAWNGRRGLGAFADGATLIGVAVLSTSGPSQGQAGVAVVPGCRRLGVGSELADVLVHEVQGRGLKTLTCTRASADPVPQQFVRSLQLTTTRRVNSNTAVMVLVVTDAPPHNLRHQQ
jgi:GNAT superfamily N-acetyltransferase